MANETGTNNLSVLITNKRGKGSYRVYKPKTLKMPKRKKK